MTKGHWQVSQTFTIWQVLALALLATLASHFRNLRREPMLFVMAVIAYIGTGLLLSPFVSPIGDSGPSLLIRLSDVFVVFAAIEVVSGLAATYFVASVATGTPVQQQPMGDAPSKDQDT